MSYGYDALGRLVSEGNGARTLRSQYDEAGRRTRLTWSDGFFVTYDYLVTGESTALRENGSSAGASLLATFSYDNLGRRTRLSRGNSTLTTYGYDALHLTSLGQDLVGTAWDQAFGFGYNPASQLVTRTSNGDAYAFTQTDTVSRSYTTNALNQYSQTSEGAPVAFSYDGRGNLTAVGSTSYAYDARNLLMSSSAGSSTFTYDPTSRLRMIGAEGRVLDYDGPNLVAEYTTSGQLVRRYVHSVSTDEPIVWYEGAGTNDRRWLHANHQGSTMAVSDGDGNPLAINTYDRYGVPASTNLGRFQYTGQTWISGLGLYNYKARLYSPTLGRFMQIDPIGYQDDFNLYAYVKNDPLNKADPTGRNAIAGAIGIGLGIYGAYTVCEASGGCNSARDVAEKLVGAAIKGIEYGATARERMLSEAGKSDSPAPSAKPAEQPGGDAKPSNTNPYSGPVDEPVTVVDSNGNAIPVSSGEQISTSPNGDYQQVRDKAGNPTGVRLDRGGHRTHSDPVAKGPHGHVPGVTQPNGNPHLPIKCPNPAGGC